MVFRAEYLCLATLSREKYWYLLKNLYPCNKIAIQGDSKIACKSNHFSLFPFKMTASFRLVARNTSTLTYN